MSVHRKNCLMLVTVFLGFTPFVCEKKGGANKKRPVTVKWIRTIGLHWNFDSPITLSCVVLPLWIVTSGREVP